MEWSGDLPHGKHVVPATVECVLLRPFIVFSSLIKWLLKLKNLQLDYYLLNISFLQVWQVRLTMCCPSLSRVWSKTPFESSQRGVGGGSRDLQRIRRLRHCDAWWKQLEEETTRKGKQNERHKSSSRSENIQNWTVRFRGTSSSAR